MTLSVKHRRRRTAPQLFVPRLLPGMMLALMLALCLPQLAPAADLPPIRESQAETVGSGGQSLSLEERVKRLENLLEGQALVEMLMQIEELQKDVQELRGQNETYAHEVEGIKKRQRELYMDIDRRLRQLMEASNTTAAGTGTGMPSTTTVPTPQMGASLSAGGAAGRPTAVDPQAEKNAYSKAFNVLKDRHYEQAILAFAQFLQVYPDGQYADNAIYWTGEAKYFLERYDQAIEDFKRVTTRFPNSPKQADALLKIGYSYYQMKKWPETRQALQEVITRFPDSTAATLAGKRLHQMKVDGL